MTARAFLLLLTIGAVGCGGGGSPTEPPPPPPAVISFQSSGGQGSQSLFLALAEGATADTVVLNLQSAGVSGLYGIAFDLLFPSNLLVLASIEQGDFLDGEATSFEADTSEIGKATVGLTRLGDVAGQDGDGVLLRLTFSRVGSGSGPITFDRNEAFGEQGVDRFEITWSGGSVIVP